PLRLGPVSFHSCLPAHRSFGPRQAIFLFGDGGGVAVRQRRTIGAVLKVPLDRRWHAYAWTLPEADFAFFDLRADSDIPLEEVVRRPIAFRVAVHKSAWTTGR